MTKVLAPCYHYYVSFHVIYSAKIQDSVDAHFSLGNN